jgi:hypothetical protein
MTDGKMTFDNHMQVKQLVINDITTIFFAFADGKENWEQVKIRIPKLTVKAKMWIS